MPYTSAAQAAKIHILARQGVAWAVKFVAENHGTHVQKKLTRRKRQLRKKN